MLDEKRTEERFGDLLIKREVRLIEQYGIKLEYGLVHEVRPAWERRFILEDGKELTYAEAKELRDSGKVGEGAIAKVVWTKTGETVTGTQPEYCKLFDNEHAQQGRPVYLFGTTDGPIITALEKHQDSDWMTFWDPAHVQYSTNGMINLVPIFGVARYMDMHVSSVKQRAVPATVLGEVYLQYTMQNRQFSYELRPVKPAVATEKLSNDEEAPGIQVE